MCAGAGGAGGGESAGGGVGQGQGGDTRRGQSAAGRGARRDEGDRGDVEVCAGDRGSGAGEPGAVGGDCVSARGEAIRPTSNHRTPESIKKYLTNDQYRLYKLIYNRALASMMKPKKEEVMTITLEGNGLKFKVELAHTVFKGYEVVYYDPEEPKDYSGNFPTLEVGTEVAVTIKSGEQKYTQAPAKYSEAKLVKLMEDVGIGRPSTYASTIKILKDRKYVDDVGGILTSTEQGKKTAYVLNKYFPEIINAKYTAKMEEQLDNVQSATESRVQALSSFYNTFIKQIETAYVIMYKDREEPTGDLCPKCGSPLVYKEGANGRFVGCSNYPACKYVQKEKKEVIYTGETCPICGKPLVERQDKKGKKFVACSGFPGCTYVKEEKVVVDESKYVKPCPQCDGHLIKKKGKYGYFLGCTNYPTCNYMEKMYKKKRK